MARTTGALLSFGASGKIADTQVYASWRGIPYARRYVVPANPRTPEQTKTRNTFKWANASWLFLPAIAKEPWTAYANGRPFVPRNGWVSRAVSLLRGKDSIADLEGSPGVAGGLPSDGMTCTPDVDSIAVQVAVPEAPMGFEVLAVQAICVPDQDPHDLFFGPIEAEQATEAPFTVNFNGLAPETDYVVSAWIKWSRGGGKTAYSISRTELVSTN